MEKLYKDLIKQVAADETRRKEAKRSPAKHGAPAETILEVAGERAEGDDDQAEDVIDPATMHKEGKIKRIEG